MGIRKVFKFIVEGGRATAGPPIGPALGPLGLNLMEVVNKINSATREFSGMKVPVEVEVDVDEKTFEVRVGTPTVSALIIRELKVEKGSSKAGQEKVGDLSMAQVVKIAKIKRGSLLSKTLKGAVKEVLGACLSMGVSVEGKDPRQVQREVDQGLYDDLIREG